MYDESNLKPLGIFKRRFWEELFLHSVVTQNMYANVRNSRESTVSATM